MTEDRRNFGSRLLAFLGLWLMLSGLLLALSFVDVVLVANGILLVVGTVTAAVWGLRRIEFERKLATAVLVTAHATRGLGGRVRLLHVRDRAARLGAASRKGATRLGASGWKAATAGGLLAARAGRIVWRGFRALGVRRRIARVGAASVRRATGIPGHAEVLLARGLRAYALAAYRLQLWTGRAANAGARLATSLPRREGRPTDESRQARRLNALGTQLRRQGDHERAAEQHLVALEIAQDLGDEQAEALTLNNLALALAQAGAEEEAVEHLEHARDVLHELGDAEHEGQVIANLGMVHRRQGHADMAETLLHEALDKLPPESSAYRQVEAELSRAS